MAGRQANKEDMDVSSRHMQTGETERRQSNGATNRNKLPKRLATSTCHARGKGDHHGGVVISVTTDTQAAGPIFGKLRHVEKLGILC